MSKFVLFVGTTTRKPTSLLKLRNTKCKGKSKGEKDMSSYYSSFLLLQVTSQKIFFFRYVNFELLLHGLLIVLRSQDDSCGGIVIVTRSLHIRPTVKIASLCIVVDILL